MNEPVFDYIVCIDFEATCWENQAPPQWRESEIIGKLLTVNYYYYLQLLFFL